SAGRGRTARHRRPPRPLRARGVSRCRLGGDNSRRGTLASQPPVTRETRKSSVGFPTHLNIFDGGVTGGGARARAADRRLRHPRYFPRPPVADEGPPLRIARRAAHLDSGAIPPSRRAPISPSAAHRPAVRLSWPILIVVGDTKHHFPGGLVAHIVGEREHFFGAPPPMIGIVDDG